MLDFDIGAARALHEAFPAIDLHDDLLMWCRWLRYDPRLRHEPLRGGRFARHVDLPRLREGGVGAQFFGLVSLPVFGSRGCFRAVDRQIDVLESLAASTGTLRVSRTAEDISLANAEGAVAALLGIEGAHCLEGDLANLDHFARRGVRYLGLSHFSANEACRPCVGRGRDDSRGLTPFGRTLVERCLALGVIPDLAHVNKLGFVESCAIARRAGRPVIDSHTGVLGAYAHVRNIDDDQIRALADTGGVMGVIFAKAYLGGDRVLDVVAHLNHMVGVAGHDHVALGSDYDGMVTPVAGLRDVSMLPNLTAALLADGWSVENVGKLLRRNVMRVLRDTPSPR